MSGDFINVFQAAKTMGNCCNWSLSNLQMQKLLYFVQMYYIGNHNGEPMFPEKFEAWEYGPVIPAIYHELKIFGNNYINDVFQKEKLLENEDEKFKYFESARQLFSKVSASRLVDITHREGGGWDAVYKIGIRGVVIENDLILDEYNKFHNKND